MTTARSESEAGGALATTDIGDRARCGPGGGTSREDGSGVAEHFTGEHPLCDCPPITFTSAPSAEQIEACRARSQGITHKMMTAEDLRRALDSFRA